MKNSIKNSNKKVIESQFLSDPAYREVKRKISIFSIIFTLIIGIVCGILSFFNHMTLLVLFISLFLLYFVPFVFKHIMLKKYINRRSMSSEDGDES